ncbi:unnamed protein product [Rotaria sordida]|uniref:Methyltransferase FkbM domain-containing protein n=1 Tax=Rotaria sordida TaxID=392033 RepID=A0A815ENF7_9BILA|nr:unnamed protein product [Rotaria sordida]CAF1312716.1 unnamed protein product [Rotaria sordida]CAF1318109.1 unnamed protein product [Rotaria sordida]
MTTKNPTYALQERKFSDILNYITWILKKFSNILFILSIPIVVGLFYHIYFFTDYKLSIQSSSFERLKSMIGNFAQYETTTESTTESTTIEITTTTIITTTTTPFEIVVDMDDRTPLYQLATRNGSKPFTGGARTKLFEIVRLHDTCRTNTSLIVVDVGANLGDFGLYAAACNCSVYMFERQPEVIALLQISIAVNEFTQPPVHLFYNAIGDTPLNSTFLEGSSNYNTKNLITPITVQTVQFDNIAWSSLIYILKIDFDNFGLNVLRSGQDLFRKRRVRHLILEYNSVTNDQATKQALVNYIHQTLRPKHVFVFHPDEETLYGPLFFRHLKDLPNQQNDQRPIVGLFAIMGIRMKKESINAEPYNADSFFA